MFGFQVIGAIITQLESMFGLKVNGKEREEVRFGLKGIGRRFLADISGFQVIGEEYNQLVKQALKFLTFGKE